MKTRKMKTHKIISFLLAGIMLTGTVLFSACAKPQTTSSKTTDTSKNDASSVAATAEPEPIRFFMGTAGLKFPDGVGPNDNAYINKIAELANVKFTEVICPEYSDFQTKFNLMFSTNDIPDLVHCWFPSDVQTQGEAGAFMELSDIISSSSVLSKTYNDSMLNLMKNDQDHIFALRAQAPLDTMSAAVNPWLIQELNNGVVPTEPNDWYELFKKLKEKYPNAVPFSAIGGLDGLELFFKAYGASVGAGGAAWQYKDGKVISAFEAPMIKDAIEFYQKLYKEGLLDKTFVTNKNEDYADRRENKHMILWSNNTNSCIGKNVVPAALPRVSDSQVTDSDAYYAMALLGGHCLAIGAKTEHKDAVVRLIETLYSDDVKMLSSWGIEGADYNIVNGEKVLTAESNNTFGLRSMYRMTWNYGNDESVAISTSRVISQQPDEKRDYFSKMLNDGLTVSYDLSKKASPSPVDYIQLSSNAQTKLAEAGEMSKTILVKAILGEISMDEYDKQVASYLEKYQFITDEYNSKLPDMLNKLK